MENLLNKFALYPTRAEAAFTATLERVVCPSL